MVLKKWFAVGGVVLSALGATQALAVPKPGAEVRAQVLKNGMKVIVWPVPDNPSVALFNWFRVGSRNERPGITGLSHFFEHMMFNGAQKYGPGEFDRVMQANGANNNAYTSTDVTVYQDWFPRSALETVFDIEADRIAHLTIDPKLVESERQVVYSERRNTVDDNNANLLTEQVQATAFLAHPYQIPTLGWPSDIEHWTQKDLEQYFRTYYAPNNATLLVIGAVTPEEVFALAHKYLEPIPAQPMPEPLHTVEPVQQGERRLVVHRPGQTPLLQMAFHGPRAQDEEVPALELLLRILMDGKSSRLFQRMVEQERVAIRVSKDWSEGFDPALAWVVVELPPGGDPARAEKVLDEELTRVSAEGVTEAELRKAQNILLAEFWRNLDTNHGRAQALGSYEVFHGDWQKLFSAPERYAAVTREQVRQVAVKLFAHDNRTVGTLLPVTDADAKKDLQKEKAR